MIFVKLLRVFEVAHGRVPGTAVKFHVGDNIDCLRHIRLADMIQDRRVQDQFKNCLNIGVRCLAEAPAILYLVHEIPALDLNHPRPHGEGNKVIAEQAVVPLRKVHAQGHRHGKGTGLALPEHGARSVYHTDCVPVIRIVFEGVPGSVQDLPFLFCAPKIQSLIHKVRGCQGRSMQCCLALGNLLHELQIAFLVVAQESAAILIHRAGRLRFIAEGIILFPQAVLQDTQIRTQPGQRLPVRGIAHAELPGKQLAHMHGFLVGSVDGRQPLCQQRNGFAAFSVLRILLQLASDQFNHIRLTGRVRQAKQVVIATHFRNVFQVLSYAFRMLFSEFME